jgi:hypothetical protein
MPPDHLNPQLCRAVLSDGSDLALAQMQPMMARYPLGFGQWLQALACALSKPRELAIVGDPEGTDT